MRRIIVVVINKVLQNVQLLYDVILHEFEHPAELIEEPTGKERMDNKVRAIQQSASVLSFAMSEVTTNSLDQLSVTVDVILRANR